ncbi:kinase-like domain-containing protein [Aspergillus multicolor]|uniref:kinase-like domain-containing protein n=1 Tax=Aspergillus multicolor TaxID=41759 RepID=UPI003CCDBAF9
MPRKHIKLAVKRLSGGLSGSNDFAREYENLYRVARARHPWLVNLIGAFMKSEGSIGRYNLVFPLPIGNLEQLFDGSTRHASLLTWKDTLWGQFQGLADALRCLHDECHLVHANLKASNILVHERSGDSNLIAQIADFSLANGLQNVPARLSRRFRGNDVWFLGVVFAELLTFLVRGHRGIVRIRSWFPRTWGQSTWENNKPFPYREGVRRKVMEWLTRLSSDSTRAQEIAKAIILTLSNAGSMPSAADVAAAFLKTSTVLLSDGRRIVQFILSADCPEPSWFDKARATVEGLIGAPVDWWPAPPVLYKCPPDSTRIKWKWHRHDLYVDLPTGLVQSYKEKCCRPLSSIPQSALLPQFVTAPGTTTTTNLSQSGASNTPSQGSANVNSGQQQGAGSSSATIMSALPNTTSSKLSQIYWCVDKAWIEPLETWLCIENSQHSADDRELCARLRKLYDSVRGIRGRLLSWKTCLGIRFVRVSFLLGNEGTGSQYNYYSLTGSTIRETL